MQLLEARLKQLEDAFNTNTKVFSDGMQMLEAQNEVLRRALRDVMNGRAILPLDEARMAEVPVAMRELLVAEPHIDFNAYLKEYIEELADKEEASEKSKANGGPLLVESDPEQPTIFGGG